jgi:hypothetical protein
VSQSNTEQLRQHYAELDDHALLTLLRKNSLTEDAQEIAMLELTSRGIELDPDRVGASDQIEPEEDESIDLDAEAMDSLIAIAQFSSPTDAHMLEFRLQAEGIPAWATNTNTTQALSHMTLALGGVKVMVPTHLAAEAKEVMQRLEAGEFALDDDFEEQN